MCLTNRVNCQIDEVNAFKIFTRNTEGNLQSAFKNAVAALLSNHPLYAANQRIRVNNEDSTFFAFESFDVASCIAMEGTRGWRFINSSLVVLPVTLYEVVSKGQFWVPSGDPQCLDGYYPAYESKEIVVHDSAENRALFQDQIIRSSYSLSTIEKEAIHERLSTLGVHIK